MKKLQDGLVYGLATTAIGCIPGIGMYIGFGTTQFLWFLLACFIGGFFVGIKEENIKER